MKVDADVTIDMSGCEEAKALLPKQMLGALYKACQRGVDIARRTTGFTNRSGDTRNSVRAGTTKDEKSAYLLVEWPGGVLEKGTEDRHTKRGRFTGRLSAAPFILPAMKQANVEAFVREAAAQND